MSEPTTTTPESAESATAILARFEDLKRERDEALNELLAVRTVIAGAMVEHQGQGLPDLVKGLVEECSRRRDEWVTTVGVIAAMQDGRGPVRRAAQPE